MSTVKPMKTVKVESPSNTMNMMLPVRPPVADLAGFAILAPFEHDLAGPDGPLQRLGRIRPARFAQGRQRQLQQLQLVP